MYEHFGLQKQSPTVGMFFYPDDYICMIANIKYYFSLPLEIIDATDSKNYARLVNDGVEGCLIGRIGDIEAVLVHYKDKNVAVEKWNRRCKRINYNNLIFKFCEQNGCTKEHLLRFDSMDLPGKKIMFTCHDERDKYRCGIYYPGFEDVGQIMNDTFYWDKYFDIISFLNK